MNPDIEKILYDQAQVEARIDALAETLTQRYQDQLLLQRLDFKLNIDYVDVSSYEDNAESSGRVRLLRDLSHDVTDRPVLIVEDIIDTGHTLKFLDQLFASRGAKSIATCALLDKPSRREVEVDAAYIGFEVPNEFIVGYGLDYNGLYRNLPYIGVLKRSIYE